jgi:hypothetical protein
VSGNCASPYAIFFTRVRGAENLGLKNEPSVWRGLDVVKSKRIARRRLTGDRVQFGQQGDAFLLVGVGARNDRSRRLGLAHVVRQVRRVGGNARRQTQVADCSVALSDIIGSLPDSRERSGVYLRSLGCRSGGTSEPPEARSTKNRPILQALDRPPPAYTRSPARLRAFGRLRCRLRSSRRGPYGSGPCPSCRWS